MGKNPEDTMVKLIVPSHNRPDRVLTVNAVAGCTICIPDSQYDDYAKNYPEKTLLAHPDGIVGITAKRQWIIDQFPDVFQIDDDVHSVNRLYGPQNYHKPTKLTPQEAHDLIVDTHMMLKEQTEIRFYSFSRYANATHYPMDRPIRVVSTSRCAFGFIDGHGLRYPEEQLLTGEDEYISLMNAYQNRIVWQDQRFFFNFDTTNTNIGGCGDTRTMEAEKKSFLLLKKSFGDAVRLVDNTFKMKAKYPF